MPTARENDPLGAFNFYLSLVDSPVVSDGLAGPAGNYQVAGFAECTGLDATVDVFEYVEGGVNDYVHKFPSRAKFGNITLKRGVISLSDDLWSWHNDFVQGRGIRKNGLIYLLNEGRIPAKVWKFKRGIPTKWVGPSLNASQSLVAIESLEIAHEGLILDTGPSVNIGLSVTAGLSVSAGLNVDAGLSVNAGLSVDAGLSLNTGT
jgi:phage tail-like protein